MESVIKTYKYCIVPMCKNTTKKTPNKVFFFVPMNKNIRSKWCKVMKRNLLSSTCILYCCEDHFNIEDDTENYMQYKIMTLQEGQKISLRLKKGVLPHIFQCQKVKQISSPMKTGCLSKQRKALVEEATSEEKDQSSQCDNEMVSFVDPLIYSKNVDKSIQVNMKVPYRSKGVNTIRLSPVPLQAKSFETCPAMLSSDYEPDSSSPPSGHSESDDQFKSLMRSATLLAIKTESKMLLGLPKRCYYLIKFLSDNIPVPTIHILITLKKIKLNESFDILGLQFGYSQCTVRRVFAKSIPKISKKMKELIVWPTPSVIFKHLPIAFRARFKNVVSIIDCLEIQIEKPSNPVRDSLTWSQYKKCNTLKYLISCTPSGLINFISSGYDGRVTDLYIVEDCGYLECLPINMDVMAGSGFNDLSRLLENKNCTLVRPPPVSQSVPSTKEEVKQSKRVAALRIYVERVISRLRDFHILLPHASVDHDLISLIDEVILVVCGIINLQDVLIKKY